MSRKLGPVLRDAGEPTWTLRTLHDALRRRSLLALAVFLTVAALGFAGTAMLQPRFTATALVVVDNTEARLLELGNGIPDLVTAPGSIETQTEIARSPGILTAVIDQLSLGSDEEFLYRASLVNRTLGMLGLSPVPVTVTPGDEASAAMARTAVVENLERAVSVRRRGLTNVIAIAVQSSDPMKAARIANAIAGAYIGAQAAQKSAAARNAVAVLRGRAADLETRIRQIEGDMGAFVNSAAESYGSATDVAAIRELTASIDRQALAQSRTLATLSSLDTFLQTGQVDDLPGNATALQPSVAALLGERSKLVASVQAGDRRMEEIGSELDALDVRLKDAVRATATSLEDEVKATDSRVTSLRGDLEQRLGSISLPNTAAVQFYTLQREAKASRDLYEATLDRLRELEQQADFAASDSRLVSEALVPNRISFPPVKLLLAMSVLLAAAAGAVAAILRDRYVGGFSSSSQMAEITGQEVLATVPLHRPRGTRLCDTLIDEPLSPFAEAFRRLKLGVEAALEYRQNIVVMVTSTMPGEGKSTVALALAEIFAQAGRKTLLVDADLRRPSIARILGFETEHGLTDYLTGTAQVRDAVVTDTRYPGNQLSLLVARDQGAMPTDRMLESERFRTLLRSAANSFEVVVVDTPPVGDVVDARIIARNADLCLYVVRWGQVNQGRVIEGLRELARGAPAPTGLVLNQSADGPTQGAGYYAQLQR